MTGGSPEAPGDCLIDLGGAMSVYGGSFTGGMGGFGIAMSSGSLTGMGTITGMLQDNTSASTFTYRVLDGASLNINGPAAVPEASTTASLGLLLALGMGSVYAARRKKAAARD